VGGRRGIPDQPAVVYIAWIENIGFDLPRWAADYIGLEQHRTKLLCPMTKTGQLKISTQIYRHHRDFEHIIHSSFELRLECQYKREGFGKSNTNQPILITHFDPRILFFGGKHDGLPGILSDNYLKKG
jgi:hypothetical protein